MDDRLVTLLTATGLLDIGDSLINDKPKVTEVKKPVMYREPEELEIEEEKEEVIIEEVIEEVREVEEKKTLYQKVNDAIEEQESEEDYVMSDKEILIRDIISYGITIDGVKEKSSKMFDFSFDYRGNDLDVSLLNMQLEDEFDEEIKEPRIKLNIFKRKVR